MATQFDPIAKDESLNTTEATPRNIADVIVEGLKGIEDALPTYTEGDGIDISNNAISVDTTFAEASTRSNIDSGESFSTILGKIKKWFTDVAVKNANNLFSADQTIDRKDGTASAEGQSLLTLGNSTPVGTDQNSTGLIHLYSESAYPAVLYASPLTQTRYVGFPNKNGTVALTSDFETTKVTTGYDIVAFKCANVVTLCFVLNVASAAAGETFATLPSGLRPGYTVDFRDTYGNKRIQINTSGQISCVDSALANQAIRGTVTYVAVS
jgi:hypothetical protein